MKTKLLFLVLVLCSKTWAQIPTTNLDSEYNFSSNILDTYGTAENLTQTGSASTFITDRFGGSTSAMNLAGDYFKRSALFSNDLSVSFWIKTSVVNANKQTIIDQSSRTSSVEDNTKPGWYIYLQNGKIGLAANFSWYFTVGGVGGIPYSGNSDYTNSISTSTIANNSWQHVVITMQKSSDYPSAGVLRMRYFYKIYVNNVLEISNGDQYYSMTGSGLHQWNLMSTLRSISISNNHLNNLISTNRYSGIIDDIRLYKTTLTATEVLSLYNEASALSRNDFNSFSNFSIYPNPANGIVNVKSEESIENIEILSLEGRKVKYSLKDNIDISDLSNGMYILQIKTNDGKLGTKKIIKN
ncbi:T9SS type A sorting domain-containing protein [Flavobacterium sp.]|uniref:T9SS type A sorting domain-containing protein n=1 Tax=Flavobacterium sp. TaxID=239 RepID=UPI00286E1BD4|nr:T9SS type A sorting domain-containing protein [Flavobacterium sp.]